jgi:hypothetical protein
LALSKSKESFVKKYIFKAKNKGYSESQIKKGLAKGGVKGKDAQRFFRKNVPIYKNPAFWAILIFLLLGAVILGIVLMNQSDDDKTRERETTIDPSSIDPIIPSQNECTLDSDCQNGFECNLGVCVDEDKKVEASCGDGLCFIGEESCLVDCPPGTIPKINDGGGSNGGGDSGGGDSDDGTDSDGDVDSCLDGTIVCSEDETCTDLGVCEQNVVVSECSNVLPTCADGVDNDGDGRVDLDDPQCGWWNLEETETITHMIECETTDHCYGEGEICNDLGMCEVVNCVDYPGECEEVGRVCDETTGLCESVTPGCLRDLDCLEGEICNLATSLCEEEVVIDGSCTPGAVSCPIGEYCAISGFCEEITCVEDPSICTLGYVCSEDTGLCEEEVENVCPVIVIGDQEYVVGESLEVAYTIYDLETLVEELDLEFGLPLREDGYWEEPLEGTYEVSVRVNDGECITEESFTLRISDPDIDIVSNTCPTIDETRSVLYQEERGALVYYLEDGAEAYIDLSQVVYDLETPTEELRLWFGSPLSGDAQDTGIWEFVQEERSYYGEYPIEVQVADEDESCGDFGYVDKYINLIVERPGENVCPIIDQTLHPNYNDRREAIVYNVEEGEEVIIDLSDVIYDLETSTDELRLWFGSPLSGDAQDTGVWEFTEEGDAYYNKYYMEVQAGDDDESCGDFGYVSEYIDLIVKKPGPNCQNKIDDDDDGLVDYPEDPGCNSEDDGLEVISYTTYIDTCVSTHGTNDAGDCGTNTVCFNPEGFAEGVCLAPCDGFADDCSERFGEDYACGKTYTWYDESDSLYHSEAHCISTNPEQCFDQDNGDVTKKGYFVGVGSYSPTAVWGGSGPTVQIDVCAEEGLPHGGVPGYYGFDLDEYLCNYPEDRYEDCPGPDCSVHNFKRTDCSWEDPDFKCINTVCQDPEGIIYAPEQEQNFGQKLLQFFKSLISVETQ